MRDLLARRFLLHESQRALSHDDVLHATADPLPSSLSDDLLPAIDHSRALHQYLLSCSACMAITRTDRPSRSDDVVPGRVSLAVPGWVVVRAARRLEHAARSGRATREMRTLAADPLRRYALRVPLVFRAVRPAFAENAVLVADATWAFWRAENAGPQGLVWDDGPPAGDGRARIRRLVGRALPALQSATRALPYQYGEVDVMSPRSRHGFVIRLGRETRLPIRGEAGAALHVGPPRVKFDEPAGRLFETEQPPDGFVVPLDLVRPE